MQPLAPDLETILGQAFTPRKRELTPSVRARLTRRLPPRIDQLLTFYDSAKVRGRTCSFNITTLATITDVPWEAALDVVMACTALDLCHFPHPPYGIVNIRPAHREARSFLEEEDYRRLAYLTEKAAAGQTPWQEGGGA